MAGAREQESAGAVSYVNVELPDAGPAGTDARLVDSIVRALYANPETRAAIEAAAGGRVTDQPRYVSSSELAGTAPPVGVPFYEPHIHVLQVPAPARGGVEAVRAAIQGVAKGVRVTPDVTMSTLSET